METIEEFRYRWKCVKCGAEGHSEFDYPLKHIEKGSDPKTDCSHVAWPVLKDKPEEEKDTNESV